MLNSEESDPFQLKEKESSKRSKHIKFLIFARDGV